MMLRWLFITADDMQLEEWTEARKAKAEAFTERYLLGHCDVASKHVVPGWKVDRERRAQAMSQPRAKLLMMR